MTVSVVDDTHIIWAGQVRDHINMLFRCDVLKCMHSVDVTTLSDSQVWELTPLTPVKLVAVEATHPYPMFSSMWFVFLLVAIVLVIFAGIVAGLTLVRRA